MGAILGLPAFAIYDITFRDDINDYEFHSGAVTLHMEKDGRQCLGDYTIDYESQEEFLLELKQDEEEPKHSEYLNGTGTTKFDGCFYAIHVTLNGREELRSR